MVLGPGDRELGKYITPWPGGTHTQQGFPDRLQYGVVGHEGAEGTQKPLSQAREGWKAGSGKASHRGRCLNRAVKEE